MLASSKLCKMRLSQASLAAIPIIAQQFSKRLLYVPILTSTNYPRISSYYSTLSTSATSSSWTLDSNKFNTNMFNLIKRYEDVIGLTEVKIAQQQVLEAERDLTKMQEARREKQDEIRDVQTRLKEIHVELDKTSRGEDRYLNLLTQEHALIKREKTLVDDFNKLERSERDCFTLLSSRLRESHEKERQRGERTKYWSIVGCLLGGALGILGTMINNKLRIRDLRQIVKETSEPGRFQTVVDQLSAMVRTQQQQIALFVKDLNNILRAGGKSGAAGAAVVVPIGFKEDNAVANELMSPQGDAILAALKDQDEKLENQMKELKQMIAVEHGYTIEGGSADGAVVYVGPKMEQLLDQTEKNLEWKIKINALVNVVLIYTALAITLPILYAMLRGGG